MDEETKKYVNSILVYLDDAIKFHSRRLGKLEDRVFAKDPEKWWDEEAEEEG